VLGEREERWQWESIIVCSRVPRPKQITANKKRLSVACRKDKDGFPDSDDFLDIWSRVLRQILVSRLTESGL